MNKELTEIVVLLDASGSIQAIRDDAVGGFNAFIEEQKKVDGEANLTVIFFDSNRFQKWQDGIELKDCPVLGAEFRPGASTPLLDATGRTIEELGARLAAIDEAKRPGRVLVIILTDGLENASRLFTREQVKRSIRHKEEVFNWEFVFLAANVDAFAEGAGLGVKRASTAGFVASRKGVRAAFVA